MAKITKSISTKIDKQTNKVEIYLRFRAGRKATLRGKSGIFIDKKQWNEKKGELKTATFGKEEFEIKQKLDNLCSIIIETYTNTSIEDIDKEWLQKIIKTFHHKPRASGSKKTQQEKPQHNFFDLAKKYIEISKHTPSTTRQYWVVYRALQRYELWKRKSIRAFRIDVNTIDEDQLRDFEHFLFDEHKHYNEHLDIYKSIPESRTPQPRGQNTVNGLFRKLRAIILWSVNQEITTNNPFKKYKIEESIYGTPYYLTIEERNTIYNTQFPDNPQQEIQKDIFIFQCLIGCRIGDLLSLTKENLIDGVIEYIPSKTKDERATTVAVPLSPTAQEIINKYAETAEGEEESDKLLPFISEQQYNIYIKKILTEVGITRMVTILNPTTRKEEKKALNEIASSHIARRTFIGNLYKKVKDPNLVGALSGHKEGSKAFARYREIDKDIKRDLVNLLE